MFFTYCDQKEAILRWKSGEMMGKLASLDAMEPYCEGKRT